MRYLGSSTHASCTRSLALAAVLGALSLLISASVDAWQPLLTEQDVPLRWYRGTIPYTPPLHPPSLPSGQKQGFTAAIEGAFSRWQELHCELCSSVDGAGCPALACPSNPLGLRFVSRPPRDPPYPCELGIDGEVSCVLDGRQEGPLIFVRDPVQWVFGSKLVALTLISHRVEDGEIQATSVLFNEVDHAFCLDLCLGGRYPLSTVLTHEIGHMLGLDHSQKSGSIMAPSVAMGQPKGGDPSRGGLSGAVQLSEDDRLGVCELYRVDARPGAICDMQQERSVGNCSASRRGRSRGMFLLLFLSIAPLWWVMRRRGSAISVLFLSLGLLWSNSAGAWEQAVAESGAHLRWYVPEITYTIDKDALSIEGVGSEKMQAAVQASFASWEAVQCELCHSPRGVSCEPVACAAHSLGLHFLFGGFADPLPFGLGCADGSAPPKGCAPSVKARAACKPAPNGNQIEIVRASEDWCFGSYTIAMTLVSANEVSGEIVDADILLNAAYKLFCDGNCGSSGWDLRNTLTHEIGHFLGLDHSDRPSSTMFAGAPAGETAKRSLEEDDVQGVCHSYRKAWSAEGCPSPEEDTCCQVRGTRSASQEGRSALLWLAALSIGVVIGRRALV